MTPNSDRDGHNRSTENEAPFRSPPRSILSPRTPPASTSTAPRSKPDWNTEHLPWRVGSDITAAACASGLVSPLITIIDRAIIEKASNRCTLQKSLRSSLYHLFTRPHRFLTSKPALLIATLYFGTYLTANLVDTLSSAFTNKPAHTTSTGPTKFLATTSVNMSLCLYKDSQFARMFGTPVNPLAAAARKLPAASYALFALRDSLTIFASFNLPPLIAPIVPLSEEMEKQVSRASAAQFLAPAGIQLLSTPLHLWGLDLYNRPGVGYKGRVRRVSRDWLGGSLARMGRIVPAFGVGGVVNLGVRKGMIGEDTGGV